MDFGRWGGSDPRGRVKMNEKISEEELRKDLRKWLEEEGGVCPICERKYGKIVKFQDEDEFLKHLLDHSLDDLYWMLGVLLVEHGIDLEGENNET